MGCADFKLIFLASHFYYANCRHVVYASEVASYSSAYKLALDAADLVILLIIFRLLSVLVTNLHM